MKWIKNLATFVAMVCFTILLGCSSLGINVLNQGNDSANSTEKRVEIEQASGKKIIVLDNPNKGIYDEVAKIDQYKGIRGMDFYNDEQLLVVKEDINSPSISVEGGKTYPKNLYLYNTQSKKDGMLFSTPFHLQHAQYSPDHKYIYYVQSTEETGTAYITDYNARRFVQVSDEGKIHISSGYWVNDREVLYYTFFGDIYRANVNGERKLLVKTGRSNIANVVQIESKVYYTTVDNNLMVYDLDTKEKTNLKSKVMRLIPSPGQKQLAMVVGTGETKMTLILTDLKGKQKAQIAEGNQIFGTSWSPDSSKLAYTLVSDEKAQQGLFVTDMRSLKSTQISPDMKQLSDPIKWNRFSTKMLASVIDEKSGGGEFTTYVITFK